MWEYLLTIDTALFTFINTSLANPLLDVIMMAVSERWGAVALLVGICLWQLWRYRAKAIATVLCLVLPIAIGDVVNSRVLKELVSRERPCRSLPAVRAVVPCGGGKSFPSSHAVNAGAFAMAASLLWPRRKYWSISYGLLIVISRPYLGVHYPSDVVAGAALGAALAYGVNGTLARSKYMK